MSDAPDTNDSAADSLNKPEAADAPINPAQEAIDGNEASDANETSQAVEPDAVIEGGGGGGGSGDSGGTGGPPERGISTINIADEMRVSYRDYSMSVIIGRALPDARDGLKPVHRRILYAMFDEGLLSSRKHSKCAGVVGEVLKKYHPHGDGAVYDALVRLAQPWNMAMPLINGQGNFGSVDGDSAAAYRYTEARLEKIAEELLRDIEKRTVDFIPNFDGGHDEPTVLPSRVPNLLVNGSEGIAVAMATRCPPHNLGEVIDALEAVIDEEHFGGDVVDIKKLMELMKGPDFPTGGLILGRSGIKLAFETGRGSIKVRGVLRIVDDEKRKKTQIIVDEIPYQVNKAKLVEKIAALVREKKIEGIAEIRDESDRHGMRIAIDLRRDAVAEVVVNQLYKHTPLQGTFPTHMLAIVQGRPKTLPIREQLDVFIGFRREVVTRRSRFELDEAEKRFHIVAGVLTALDDIDRIITIIRSSRTTDEAKTRLIEERFPNAAKIGLFSTSPTPQIAGWLEQGYAQLDSIQAQAILEMRLSRLVGLERDKLVTEGEELLAIIDRLKEILGDLTVLMNVIKEELIDIKTRFAIPRRTQIVDDMNELSVEDLITDEEMVVTVSHAGYIKRAPLNTYRAQRRGGKGRTAAKMKDEDFVVDAFVASTHASLLAFTDVGKVYWIKVHKLPEAGPTARGRPMVNLIQLSEGEKVRAIMPVREFPTEPGKAYVVTCTQKGTVKKTDLTQYANPRASGLIACGIEEGDELIDVRITDGSSDLLLTTKTGMAIRFSENDVRSMGRPSTGVKGIGLKMGDQVVTMGLIDESLSILTVTERGYGKRTPATDYPKQRRAGQGVITMKTNDRNGGVAGAVQVSERDELMVLTDGGTLIRVKAADVSEYGRNTQGVRVLHVDPQHKVISITRIAENDEDGDDDDSLKAGEDAKVETSVASSEDAAESDAAESDAAESDAAESDAAKTDGDTSGDE